MKDIVSVIVPVYNVAAYVAECIDSILAQDYTYLDIILVNDGSTDNSGSICVEYAKRDKRIRVIHQQNAGLSAARNTGLENILGKYIAFVDSDDVLHPSYVSALLSTLVENDVNLVMCDMLKFAHERPTPEVDKNCEILTAKKTIERFLRGEWWSACAKLYRKEQFEHIRFPVGRNNEDYAILAQVFDLCTSIVYLKSPLYFYRTREGSITRSQLNNHSFDEIDNCLDVMRFIEQQHPELYQLAEANLAYSLAKLYSALVSRPNIFHNKYREIQKLYKTYSVSFLKNSSIPLKIKFFIFFHKNLSFIAPLVVKAYNVYRKIK